MQDQRNPRRVLVVRDPDPASESGRWRILDAVGRIRGAIVSHHATREEAMREAAHRGFEVLADRYVVLSKGAAGPWAAGTVTDVFDTPEEAIEFARTALDRGDFPAAVVQGRGRGDGCPTPEGQVQVWQGVGPSFSAKAFFPMHQRDEVEVRIAPKRKGRR